MADLRTYLLAVSGVALLCGIAGRFLGKKGSGACAKLVVSVFLLYTVLKPLGNLNTNLFADISFDVSAAAQAAVSRGEEQSQKAMAQVIMEQTEAYILEKAAEHHVTLQVKVELTKDALPTPVAVEISGTVAPYTKLQLQTWIEQQLGISKENQQWT